MHVHCCSIIENPPATCRQEAATISERMGELLHQIDLPFSQITCQQVQWRASHADPKRHHYRVSVKCSETDDLGFHVSLSEEGVFEVERHFTQAPEFGKELCGRRPLLELTRQLGAELLPRLVRLLGDPLVDYSATVRQALAQSRQALDRMRPSEANYVTQRLTETRATEEARAALVLELKEMVQAGTLNSPGVEDLVDSLICSLPEIREICVRQVADFKQLPKPCEAIFWEQDCQHLIDFLKQFQPFLISQEAKLPYFQKMLKDLVALAEERPKAVEQALQQLRRELGDEAAQKARLRSCHPANWKPGLPYSVTKQFRVILRYDEQDYAFHVCSKPGLEWAVRHPGLGYLPAHGRRYILREQSTDSQAARVYLFPDLFEVGQY